MTIKIFQICLLQFHQLYNSDIAIEENKSSLKVDSLVVDFFMFTSMRIEIA